MWNGASDQSLPSLLLGIDGDGWIVGGSRRTSSKMESSQNDNVVILNT